MVTSRITTERHEIEITKADILTLLRNKGVNAPDNSEVFVRVPGGGDWSNTSLSLDMCPVQVIFTETKKQ